MGTKEKVVVNMLWRLFERFGAQGVSFIVSILLARILDPSVYGTIALVSVFTAILQIFIDSGLASSLIQKKEADDLDFSTVFFFNVAFCVVLYILMFILATPIASYFNKSELGPMIRVMCLTLIASGVKNVQQAYVSRNLLFKRFFWATLGGTIGAGIIGIYMAYNGFGVWAIIAQNLFNTTVDTIILWITVKWRPKAIFSFERLKLLLSYGWKLVAARLVETIYNQSRSLIIGKQYSSTDLAYYSKGKQMPDLLVSDIDVAIESVLFPVMSQKQNDKVLFKEMVRLSSKVTTYIICPLMVGFIICADNIIKLLLTEKWLPCVPYIRIICISFILVSFNTVNMNSYRSSGRSDVYLITDIARLVYSFIVLIISINYGLRGIIIGELIASIGFLAITAIPNGKLLGYGLKSQFFDVCPTLLLSSIMGIIVFFISYLELPLVFILLLQILFGITIYLGLSYITKYEPFVYICKIVNNFLPKNFTNKNDNKN